MLYGQSCYFLDLQYTMQEKAALRRYMLEERDKLNASVKEGFDRIMCERLERLIKEKQARVVHAYLSMGSEINILPLLDRLLLEGITVVTPKAMKGRKIKNLALHSLEDLEEGIFGTKHPAHDEEFTGEIDVFIIPGLAFDRQNYRLGYGAGYYDHLLSEHKGYKAGICYPFQLTDKLPVEAHDVAMDEVLF